MSQARLMARFNAPNIALADHSIPKNDISPSAPLSRMTASTLSLTTCSEPGRKFAITSPISLCISSGSRRKLMIEMRPNMSGNIENSA